MTLAAVLEDHTRREAIVGDLARLVDQEVNGKSGMSGAALRVGYAAFLRIQPGIVRAALVRLLPDMVRVLDPHWHAAGPSGAERYFRDRAGQIADDLLSVTDAIASRSTNRVLTRMYRSMRASARDHVVQAVPKLPAVIAAHVGA